MAVRDIIEIGGYYKVKNKIERKEIHLSMQT